MSEATVFKDTRIVRFAGNAFDANSYVILENHEALMFDAVDSDEALTYLKNEDVNRVTLFLTHEHFDHILGLERLRGAFDCRVISSAECDKRIQSEKTNLSSIADVLVSMSTNAEISGAIPKFAVSAPDETFDADTELAWRGHSVKCHIMGGHSAGSACYILDSNILFPGDELLPIPVITRLPGGSSERYWKEDMPWFEEIESGISIVFPGHGQMGNIEDMIKVNTVPHKFRL